MSYPVKEELQLVVAAMHSSIRQQTNEVKGALLGGRRDMLPTGVLK